MTRTLDPKFRRYLEMLAITAVLLSLLLVVVEPAQVELRVFFHPTAKAVAAGTSAWIDGGLTGIADRNLNSPFGTLLLVPLGWLSIGNASLALGFLLVGLSVVGAALVGRRLGVPVGLAIVLFILPPSCFHALSIGQVTPVMILLFALGMPCLDHRKSSWTAVFWGVACGLKLFAGVLVIPLLLWKRWSSLSYVAIGGLGTMFIGYIAFGIGGQLEWLEALRSIDWYHHSWNVSLIGWGYRLGLVSLSYVATFAILLLSSIEIFRLRTHPTRGGTLARNPSTLHGAL